MDNKVFNKGVWAGIGIGVLYSFIVSQIVGLSKENKALKKKIKELTVEPVKDEE